LFLIYIYDIPERPDIKFNTFAHKTAFLTTDYHPRFAMNKLQRHASLLEKWFTKWRASINPDKTAPDVHTGVHLNYDYSVIKFLGQGN
jgi:hypothetical protein